MICALHPFCVAVAGIIPSLSLSLSPLCVSCSDGGESNEADPPLSEIISA